MTSGTFGGGGQGVNQNLTFADGGTLGSDVTLHLTGIFVIVRCLDYARR